MPSEAYNGLGLRVGKTDSTGTYSYVCDGASPGSPILSDGHATYTPGLSESRGGTSRYYADDLLGNLWFVDTGSGQQSYYQDTSGFGSRQGMGWGGSNPSGFGYGGGSGCQTDADTGLVLMGHRYYDSRQGRFISQDPAGDGDNWYEYADNSPTNEIDPSGLTPMDGPGSSAMGSPGYSGGSPGGEAYNIFLNLSVIHTWQEWYNVIKVDNGPADYEDTGTKVIGSDNYSLGLSGFSSFADNGNAPTFLYRGGGRSPSNLTPRPIKDTVGPERGLSVFDTVAAATKNSKIYQTIGTDNLTTLNVVPTGDPGHYSIRPDTQVELDQWAATRGTDTVSPYTKEVQSALVGSPGLAP